jgi:hypothetical protein
MEKFIICVDIFKKFSSTRLEQEKNALQVMHSMRFDGNVKYRFDNDRN